MTQTLFYSYRFVRVFGETAVSFIRSRVINLLTQFENVRSSAVASDLAQLSSSSSMEIVVVV